MAFQFTSLGALVATDPAEAARRICAALKKANGSAPDAGAALGASSRSMRRWIRQLVAKGYAIAPMRRPGGAPRRDPRPAPRRRAKTARKPAENRA